MPDPEEPRSGEEASTSQRMASMAGYLKNFLYIDNSTSIHILFNKELFEGLVNLDRPLKKLMVK